MDAMELMDDNALMRLVKEGCKPAFEILVLRYRQQAERFCRSLMQDASSVQDVVQDSFADIYVQRESYRPDFSFKTYLYALIRHKAVDYMRRNGRVFAAEDQILQECPAAETVRSPEEQWIARESRQQIYQWISELLPNHKLALYLYSVEELSYQEIAEKMKKTVAQVKIYIYRARKKLQKRREDYSC